MFAATASSAVWSQCLFGTVINASLDSPTVLFLEGQCWHAHTAQRVSLLMVCIFHCGAFVKAPFVSRNCLFSMLLLCVVLRVLRKQVEL